MNNYPEPVAQPCNECPWRRKAAPGWLGPHSAALWLEIAHSEPAIACHKTIPEGGGWEGSTRQCRGAAIFRRNVLKSPRNPSVAVGPKDTEHVFASNAEFLAHHAPSR